MREDVTIIDCRKSGDIGRLEGSMHKKSKARENDQVQKQGSLKQRATTSRHVVVVNQVVAVVAS